LDFVMDGLGDLVRVVAGAEHVDDPFRFPAVFVVVLLRFGCR